MTNLLYRSSATSTPPTSSVVKGAPLTTTEFDANLKSISDDISTKAPLASPTFTGVPAVPTAAPGTSTTQVASTAFVQDFISTKAPLASPTFTGVPAVPTAAPGTSTTQVASTAFVLSEVLTSSNILETNISTKAPLASPTFTGVPAVPTAAPGTSTTQVASTAFVQDFISTKAPLASPTFTGVPAVPTAAPGTSTTQVASTAFVLSERSSAAVLTNKTLINPASTTVTLTDASTVVWDMNLGQVAYWSITAAGRILDAPVNYKLGAMYTLFVSLSDPATMAPSLSPSIFKCQYNIQPDFSTSPITILSIIWSPLHNKFCVFPAPGL